LTGDAAEDLEVMYPYQRLLEEGYQVDIAAPTVKTLQFVVHDFVDGFDTYTEKPGRSWAGRCRIRRRESVRLCCGGGARRAGSRVPPNDPDVVGSSSTSSMSVPGCRRCATDR